ncbi:efflux RND transporter periplasmic adaptor subunit [uncultured Jannaschia sp.]|uniref:efflux RND transporter periplasmic adaptor subunit n=1 Tax=uncultured Jannaschia sp. TaxID=293347 RepID=UPI0026075A05|nr:efflux RND transporter periplasmic adaptor subunit [uncultured Jannaschia sp.]
MRLFPMITAILVCVALYAVVLDRDALLGFAYGITGDAPPAPRETNAGQRPAAIVEAAAAAADPVHVVAIRSQAREVADGVLVRGQSQAAREVTVMSETTGAVLSEPLRKGTFVEAGQVLCELDPGSREATLAESEARLAEAGARVPEAEARLPETEARIAEAQARLEEARLNQNAASRLSERGFSSETSLANAQAALRAAEAGVTAATTGRETGQAGIESARAGVQAAAAAVERARLDIEKLTIEAPFAGLLESDAAEIGTLLQPGSPCADIVQLDPMKLVGFLPEAQVDRVTTGAAARARLASGGRTEGRVTFLSRSADELTRTFRVEVTVPNEDLAIRDGETTEIVIATEPTVAHLVPASAMTLNDEGRLGVRIVENGHAGFVEVALVRDTTDGVLLAGLPAEVEIITVGQEYVTDGVPVRVTFAQDAQ